MQHSQTNVVYPASPFIFDFRRMNDTFSAITQELDRQNFLLEVASVGVDYCEYDDSVSDGSSDTAQDRANPEIYRIKEMLKYISGITETQLEDGTYDEITYYRTDQVLDSADSRYRLSADGSVTKQLWINLHTIAYAAEKERALIDSELQSTVSWCIVPIIGNVRPVSNDTLIYSDLLDYEIKAREEQAERGSLEVRSRAEVSNKEGLVDCSASQKAVNERMQRYAQRNFVKRTIEPDNAPKPDSVNSKNFKSNLPPTQIVRPNGEQIPITHARANAQNIRSAIMSKYKVNRLRQVPQMRDVHRRVDMRILNSSEMLAEKHNEEVMSKVRFLDPSYSDYRLDDVSITQINSLWKFTPMSTGRIIIDLSTPEYIIPAGESAYYRDPEKKKSKPKKSIVEDPTAPQHVMDREPDYVGDARPVPKINTRESRISKRAKTESNAEVKKEPVHKRNAPYWMSRKVVTKEEEEASKEDVGDRVGNHVTAAKTKKPKKVKPRDAVNTSRRSADTVNGISNDSTTDNRVIDPAQIPDLAFITVVRLDRKLCLTLNCLTVENYV